MPRQHKRSSLIRSWQHSLSEAQAMPNAETAATQAYGASSTVSGETVAMPATQVASADDAAATQVFQTGRPGCFGTGSACCDASLHSVESGLR